MSMRFTLTALLALLIAAMPAATGAQPSAAVRRMPADSIWRRLWTVGLDSTADLFAEPRQLVVSGNLLVVLDAGTREVRAFDAQTGAPRVMLKATGQGPGEFRRPALLSATPTGFAVIDHANARLTAFQRSGAMEWNATIPDIFSYAGLCVDAARRATFSANRRDTSLVTIDARGARVAVRSIPWRLLVRDAPSFAYTNQVASNATGTGCVIAPLFGAEWAWVPANGVPRVHMLIEPGPQPVVATSRKVISQTLTQITVQGLETSDTKQATRMAALVGDTAMLVAADTRTFPSRWLDYYHAPSGRYLFSRKLPFVPTGFAAGADGTIYVSSISESRAVVVAMRGARIGEAKSSRE